MHEFHKTYAQPIPFVCFTESFSNRMSIRMTDNDSCKRSGESLETRGNTGADANARLFFVQQKKGGGGRPTRLCKQSVATLGRSIQTMLLYHKE